MSSRPTHSLAGAIAVGCFLAAVATCFLFVLVRVP